MQDIVPQKHCPKCKNSYPATSDYFYRTKSRVSGFSPYCKRCSGKGTTFGFTNTKNYDVPLDELKQRYLNGESEKSLAELYDVARSTIRKNLLRMNVPIRSIKEANQLAMAKRTPEENKKNTEAAHKVMRGRKIPFDEQCRLAKGRQDKPGNMSPDEITLRQLLADQGIITTPQFAIGPYNADLAFKNIAIEIYGGNWHASGRHFARAKQRFNYIHGQGWNTIIIWTDTQQYPLSKNVVDLIQTYTEDFRDTSGQCKVIDGNGIEFSPDTIPYQKAIGL